MFNLQSIKSMSTKVINKYPCLVVIDKDGKEDEYLIGGDVDFLDAIVLAHKEGRFTVPQNEAKDVMRPNHYPTVGELARSVK